MITVTFHDALVTFATVIFFLIGALAGYDVGWRIGYRRGLDGKK